MKININKITTKGKTLLLAYDHGLEHGPTDFNDKDIDPDYVINIGLKGGYNGIILQKGIAEKYYNKKKHKKLPLILKLNGKTKLLKGMPYSPPLCTVKEAAALGAKAVGYTIYVGSRFEAKMFSDFESVEKDAHKKGLPVIAWMYPRGKVIKNEFSREILAYSARIGLELGADFVKMKYNNKPNDLKWVVKSAGKTKVLIAGGSKQNEKELLKEAYEVINAGASGFAIGRNIWQNKRPLKVTKALKKIVFEGKSVKESLKFLR